MFGRKVRHHFQSRQPEHVAVLDGTPVINVIDQTNGTIEFHYGQLTKQFYRKDAIANLRKLATIMNAIADELAK